MVAEGRTFNRGFLLDTTVTENVCVGPPQLALLIPPQSLLGQQGLIAGLFVQEKSEDITPTITI